MGNNGHAGNGEWVRSALEQYEGPLTRYAHRITGDVERARDVVQETFLRLCTEERGRLDGHLPEWLFTVCRNKALDVQRKERRMTTLAEMESARSQTREQTPEAAAEQSDSAAHILQLLDDLPPNQQEVIRLKFQNSLSYKEISQITGLTVTNVGFLIHRGLRTVRERVQTSNSI